MLPNFNKNKHSNLNLNSGNEFHNDRATDLYYPELGCPFRVKNCCKDQGLSPWTLHIKTIWLKKYEFLRAFILSFVSPWRMNLISWRNGFSYRTQLSSIVGNSISISFTLFFALQYFSLYKLSCFKQAAVV